MTVTNSTSLPARTTTIIALKSAIKVDEIIDFVLSRLFEERYYFFIKEIIAFEQKLCVFFVCDFFCDFFMYALFLLGF